MRAEGERFISASFSVQNSEWNLIEKYNNKKKDFDQDVSISVFFTL